LYSKIQGCKNAGRGRRGGVKCSPANLGHGAYTDLLYIAAPYSTIFLLSFQLVYLDDFPIFPHLHWKIQFLNNNCLKTKKNVDFLGKPTFFTRPVQLPTGLLNKSNR
jgi:hypothetical protein